MNHDRWGRRRANLIQLYKSGTSKRADQQCQTARKIQSFLKLTFCPCPHADVFHDGVSHANKMNKEQCLYFKCNLVYADGYIERDLEVRRWILQNKAPNGMKFVVQFTYKCACGKFQALHS